MVLSRFKKFDQTAVKRKNNVELKSINTKEILTSRNILKEFKEIKSTVKNIESLKGIARLNELTGDNIFAENMREQIKKDEKCMEFISFDLQKLGIMSRKELTDTQKKIDWAISEVKELNLSAEKMSKTIKKIINTPETYFKFARSAEVKRAGFTPNHFSEALEEAGYTKEELNKLMSLIHLPACCTTDQEWKFLQEAREKIPVLQEGIRVFHESEKDSYFGTSQGLNFDGIVGFVADPRLYQDNFTKGELIYSVLRLDFKSSRHLDGNDSKPMYAIYFSGQDVSEKSKVPFQRELSVKEDGDISDNAPYNPFTGNGFTSARNNMIIPEYQISFNDRVLFQNCDVLLGHFDKSGEFQLQFAYVEGKWKNIEDLFKGNEELQATDRGIEEKQQPIGRSDIDSKDIPWDGLER